MLSQSGSNRISTSLDDPQLRQPLAPQGFFDKISQSIFGGGAQQPAQQLNLRPQPRGSSADHQMMLQGKHHLQIFLDAQGFKNYTRLHVNDDTTAAELVKILKAKYANTQQQTQQLNTSNSGTLQIAPSLEQKVYASQSSSSNLNAKTRKPTESYKEDYSLFLINTKALTPQLMARRLQPHDIVLRIWLRALDTFIKDGEERFKICFIKCCEVETLIKARVGMSSNLDEDTHVAYQLGKSIINNKTYERKGKLFKKSLNSDKFKERQFVLDKEQLFYYKNEKQKDKNFNLIMLTNATISMGRHLKQKYCFEIENDNRRYLLSSKSEYDLNQWFFAIQEQIRLSRDNKNIADVNASIVAREKDLAQNDMQLIQRIFKPKNVIFNPVQPLLLDFINDPFINELLPGLTKYVTLVREPDYQRHALDKAKDLVFQLRALQKKLQNSKASIIGNGSLLHSKTSSDLREAYQENDDSESSITVQLLKVQSMKHQVSSDEYKRYKEMKPEQKIEQIFSNEDVEEIEQQYDKIVQDSVDHSKGIQMNPRLFNNILLKINRIIKYNYLEDFFRQKKVELLSIPTLNYKMNTTQMAFNATGISLQNKGGKNVNIFESMLIQKNGVIYGNNNSNGGGAHRRLQSQQSSNIGDQALQNQMKQFIGSISQQDERAQTIAAGITKVQNI